MRARSTVVPFVIVLSERSREHLELIRPCQSAGDRGTESIAVQSRVALPQNAAPHHRRCSTTRVRSTSRSTRREWFLDDIRTEFRGCRTVRNLAGTPDDGLGEFSTVARAGSQLTSKPPSAWHATVVSDVSRGRIGIRWARSDDDSGCGIRTTGSCWAEARWGLRRRRKIDRRELPIPNCARWCLRRMPTSRLMDRHR